MEEFADEYIEKSQDDQNLPLILKRAHTLRVAHDAQDIAADLSWPEHEIMLAGGIALLHDIARFPQYSEFQTFSDPTSFNHGEKAFEIMQAHPLLDPLPTDEKETLLTAIRYHNRKELPSGLGEHALKHLHLIRDADKIDILYSISKIIKEGWHHDHPGVLLDVELDGPVTEALIRQLLETNMGSYEHVNTLADIHLMRIAWVYSIHYKPALRRIVERNLYEETLDLLPSTPEIKEIRSRAASFVKKALESD